MSIPTGPYLDFEKDVVALEQKIEELQQHGIDGKDVEALQKKRVDKLTKAYKKLTPWNKVELARRAGRPYTLDYINNMFTDFVEMHGDRAYGEDPAIVGGFAKFNGKPVMVIGHQKGRSTKDNVYRNFGMPNPEGYRKALRLMKLAEKFNRPVLFFIDTPGAYPGIGAEERGQAEAIARNLREMAVLKVPLLVTIIGEGASGGALGIGMGDHILMLENAWYSVISPEGCAAILWGDRSKAQELTGTMKLIAPDLKEIGVIDEIIPEPIGGAHWHPAFVFEALTESFEEQLNRLESIPIDELVELRIEKYAAMGIFDDK
ncbi:MAG: acetyl-CoA carboxylase carboxyltransferase subunit alpha [Fibrobacterales bacterium]